MYKLLYRVNCDNALIWKEFSIRIRRSISPLFSAVHFHSVGSIEFVTEDKSILLENVEKHLHWLFNWCHGMVSQKDSDDSWASLKVDLTKYLYIKNKNQHKKSIVLPLNMNRHISTFPHDTYSTSIALSDRRNYPWFYHKFNQLTSIVNYAHPPARVFVNYPKDLHAEKLLQFHYSYDDLENVNDILSVIIDQLEQGCYCAACVDMFYIKGMEHYKNKHFAHTLLIYGCNAKERKLYAAGFKKKFVTFEIDYDVINVSFKTGMHWYKQSNSLMAESMALKFFKLRFDKVMFLAHVMGYPFMTLYKRVFVMSFQMRDK